PWAFSSTLSAERRPSSDASDGSLLHGPRCLHDFHSFFGHLYRAARARVLSRGALRHSAMEIPSRHSAWLNRCLWSDLVSARRAITAATYRVAWIIHCFCRLILLGALRRSVLVPIGSAWVNSNVWFCL